MGGDIRRRKQATGRGSRPRKKISADQAAHHGDELEWAWLHAAGAAKLLRSADYTKRRVELLGGQGQAYPRAGACRISAGGMTGRDGCLLHRHKRTNRSMAGALSY